MSCPAGFVFRCAKHHYKRVCPSVGPLVHWSVGPLVHRSIGLSVHNTFVKKSKIGKIGQNKNVKSTKTGNLDIVTPSGSN